MSVSLSTSWHAILRCDTVITSLIRVKESMDHQHVHVAILDDTTSLQWRHMYGAQPMTSEQASLEHSSSALALSVCLSVCLSVAAHAAHVGLYRLRCNTRRCACSLQQSSDFRLLSASVQSVVACYKYTLRHVSQLNALRPWLLRHVC